MASLLDEMVVCKSQPKRSKAWHDRTWRLFEFIRKCEKAGVITCRQRAMLEGVSASSDPAEVLRILTAKR